ncbi:MAG TPA: PilZ domain-containing protein [Burkholderiales bacterium]|jgi:hypothetical protein
MTAKNDGARAKSADRRLDQRLTTRLEAIVEDDANGSLVFTTSGFSRSGAFLRRRDEHTALPPIGSVIQITFRWPLETHMPPVQVEATVVRHTDDGVGVRFEIAA